MSLTINLNSGASAQGGVGVGLMTSAGNPWTVSDALAQDLVNRGLATAVGWSASTQQPFSNSEVGAIRGVVSAPWNQFPVSFDAVLSRVCVFGQFSDGGYLCSDGAAANGNFTRRLFKLTGDPTGAYSTAVFTATATYSNLKNVAGTAVFDANSGIQNAWIAANGDVFFMWKNATTSMYYLHRAKAGTWTVGTDAGYSNYQACIDIGSYGGTQYTEIRAFNPRAFLDFVNSAGTRTILFCEYNTHVGRDLNGGPATGDAAIVWRSTDGGATFSIFLEFNTGGAGTHRFDHFHGVVRDPYTGLVYFLTGDDGAENSMIQWDGVSAAPAANATIATIAATAGWKIRNGSELLRYTDVLFSPTCIYGLPDCDTEAAETTSTAFVSTVVDKSLGWVGTTAPLARLDNVPPAISVRGAQYSAVVSFTANAGERYLHVWTVDGQPENGASWTLVAKLRTYAAGPVSVPRSMFIDAAGYLWIGGTSGQGVQFSPEVQSGSSVRLSPVARRGAANIYDLT